MYILGQICGIISTIVTVFQPQLKKKTEILICCILSNSMIALNFVLIGQTGAAVFLCLVAIVQALVSLYHETHGTAAARWETLLFFAMYMGFGILGMVTSEGFVWGFHWKTMTELLPIIGALMLMLSVFAKSEQKMRLYLLLNAAAWAVYSFLNGATAFFSSLAAMISTMIALVKFRKNHLG